MSKFLDFLTESKEGKNLHLEHLEDNVLNAGVAGVRESINFLQSLRDMLSGKAQSHVNVTTKWDGAPSIFVGTNPENGKFFVGTKSVFNKNAKLNYTDDDIDENHPSAGLNSKLKIALAYLPKLGIKGVLQGDMMFSKGDIKTQTIDGVVLVVGDRVLVKNQTLPQDNGIYVASAGAWSRSSDMNTWAEVVSAYSFIESGTTLADTGWVVTSNAGGTLGTTPIIWTQFSGAGSYTAGTGLTLSGTQFSITNTAVTAGAYGVVGGTSFGSFTVNAQGQLTAASNVEINVDGGTF
jgi:hypothetical protein